MEVDQFFSNNNYLRLPTAKKPKVFLAVDSREMAVNSFKIYNPFSIKAKLLKRIYALMYLKDFDFVRKLIKKSKKRKSNFIEFLENKFDQALAVSIYLSTDMNKVVLQLQSDNRIMGYVKYPLNELGKKRLLNENKAIEILSKNDIIDFAISYDNFNGIPFLLLEELKGGFEIINNSGIEKILKKFKKKKSYQLIDHPRMIQLKRKLEQNNLFELKEILETISIASKKFYFEVFEHGDFAPWNVLKSRNGCFPFDFEYFEENGLEYMDMIKYHFLYGRLIKKYSFKKLLNYIYSQFSMPEINLLIQVFLIKEIMNRREEYTSLIFEKDMLDLIRDEKI